jgi:hypothetical protein
MFYILIFGLLFFNYKLLAGSGGSTNLEWPNLCFCGFQQLYEEESGSDGDFQIQ